MVTRVLAAIPWHVAVTCAEPPPLCAVIKPALLTTNTFGLSDCQLAHVDVTSRVVPFVNTPRAVTCAVAPALVNDEKFSESEKITASIVDETGAADEGTVGEDDPQEPKLSARKTAATRFAVLLTGNHSRQRNWPSSLREEGRISQTVSLFTFALSTYRQKACECPVPGDTLSRRANQAKVLLVLVL